MPISPNDSPPSEKELGKLTEQEVDTSPYDKIYHAYASGDPNYTAVRNNYNNPKVVTLKINDMHVHMQHGLKGELEEMPRVTGTSGNLFMHSCLVDKEKAQAIADFVTDIPNDNGTQKGIGVYHANGAVLRTGSFDDNFQEYSQRSEDGRPILRTFRDGTSDYGEDMEFVNSRGEKFTFERNPYCNKVYINKSDDDAFELIKAIENEKATHLLDKTLLPFYVQFSRGEISSKELDKKIDTIAKKLGIVNERFVTDFKVGIARVAEELGQKPLFPEECNTSEGAQKYLSELYNSFYKGMYSNEDYNYITKAFAEQVPNGQKALVSFQEQIPTLEKSIETNTQTTVVTAIMSQYDVNDLERTFINNSLKDAIEHDIEEQLNLKQIYEPNLRNRLKENIRKQIYRQLGNKFKAQFKEEQQHNQRHENKIDQGLIGRVNKLGRKGTILYEKTKNIRRQWLTGKIDDNQYKAKLKEAISKYEVVAPDSKRNFTKAEVNRYMKIIFDFSVRNKNVEIKRLKEEAVKEQKQERTPEQEQPKKEKRRILGFFKGLRKRSNNEFEEKSNRNKNIDNLAVFSNESNRDKAIEYLKKFKKGKITAKVLVKRLNSVTRPPKNALEQNAFHNFLERQLSHSQYQEVERLGLIALPKPLPKKLTTQELSGMSTSVAKRKPNSTIAPKTESKKRPIRRQKP